MKLISSSSPSKLSTNEDAPAPLVDEGNGLEVDDGVFFPLDLAAAVVLLRGVDGLEESRGRLPGEASAPALESLRSF